MTWTPMKIAIARAVVTGLLLGTSGFFAALPQTGNVGILATAFFSPLVGTLIARGAAEGWLDSKS